MRMSTPRLTALVLSLMAALAFSAGCTFSNVNLGIVIPLGITSDTGIFSFLHNGTLVTGSDNTSTPPLPTPPETTTTTTGTTTTTTT
jgi:hypothetical protein